MLRKKGIISILRCVFSGNDDKGAGRSTALLPTFVLVTTSGGALKVITSSESIQLVCLGSSIVVVKKIVGKLCILHGTWDFFDNFTPMLVVFLKHVDAIHRWPENLKKSRPKKLVKSN